MRIGAVAVLHRSSTSENWRRSPWAELLGGKVPTRAHLPAV